MLKTPKLQGVEFRDGTGKGCTKKWAEMRDSDDRGIFFNTDDKCGVWRSSQEDKYIAICENECFILIRNEKDKVQIFAKGNVELIAEKDIQMKANNRITMKAGSEICMEAGGSKWVVHGGEVG